MGVLHFGLRSADYGGVDAGESAAGACMMTVSGTRVAAERRVCEYLGGPVPASGEKALCWHSSGGEEK